MRTLSKQAIAAATAVALGLTAIAATPASAAPRYRHGNAAVIGAAAAIFGTIATIAAANAYRDSRPYGYAPYYGPPAPYAYAPAPYPYYGPRW